ncbi:unnamed protein product [Caretta caretta]
MRMCARSVVGQPRATRWHLTLPHKHRSCKPGPAAPSADSAGNQRRAEAEELNAPWGAPGASGDRRAGRRGSAELTHARGHLPFAQRHRSRFTRPALSSDRRRQPLPHRF